MAQKNGNGNTGNEATEQGEENMTSTAKKTASRKSAATKKSAAKRTGRTRKPRVPAGPMPQSVKSAAASALATIEERMYESEDLGVSATSSRELKGARSGLMKTIKLDDGHKVTVTVAYR